jgi:dihydrodipicolinate reductase
MNRLESTKAQKLKSTKAQKLESSKAQRSKARRSKYDIVIDFTPPEV